MTLSERCNESHWKLFFSQRVWKGVNPEFGFCFNGKGVFASIKWNGTNINKNSFVPQNEPNTAKLCFSGILKHFRQKLKKKKSLKSKK